jgi:small subunit ribosomal protein S8
MVNDTISDMLTRIRNATLIKKTFVEIPQTRLTTEIARILEREGFIQSFQVSDEAKVLRLRLKYRSKELYQGKVKESCITNLKRISKPGLRIYANHKDIPRLLNGAGMIVLSTPMGIMTDREARTRGIGGELLCSIW